MVPGHPLGTPPIPWCIGPGMALEPMLVVIPNHWISEKIADSPQHTNHFSLQIWTLHGSEAFALPAQPGVGNPMRTHSRAPFRAEPAKVMGNQTAHETFDFCDQSLPMAEAFFKSDEGQVQLCTISILWVSTSVIERIQIDSVSNPKSPTLQRVHQTMPSPRNDLLRQWHCSPTRKEEF